MDKKIQRLPKRGLKRSIFIVFGIALVIGIFTGWFLNRYKVKNIVIEGCVNANEQLIKDKLITSWQDEYTLFLYLKYKFNPPPSVPFVAKMNISMQDNHTVYVKVYEKVLIGCVAMKDSFMYFDKDGIVSETTKTRVADIPLVEGLKFNHIVLYDALVIQKQELFTTMLNLTQQIQKFALPVDKVSFNASNEVTLYCENNCEVLLGQRDFYDVQLGALVSILSKEESVNLSFDLRNYEQGTTQVIAKPKK